MAAHAAKNVAPRARRPAGCRGDPILVSKITAPDVPDWALPRPQITRLIALGTRWCPLTVVTGPVGAGKTMALAQWAAAETGPVSWVALDEYDNRPGAFWPHAVEALRRSGVALPQTLPAAPPGRAPGHVFLLRLAAALAVQDPPVTLVLDDVHLLTEPKILGGLDFLVRNARPGLRLAVSSRTDPLLPLYRYRLAGHLAEIRADDLAFSAEEAGQLLAQHGCTLSADSLECLTRRTEGWAAALRLAAIAMDSHTDPDQFVTELVTEDSALTGLLMEEVLNAQTPQTRELLLSTSILEDVSDEAASELTGNQRAGQILSALARANAFVRPAGGGSYRYHMLFGEVLRLKLRHEYPERVPLLHRRAARWYERNGQLTAAVRHAAKAADWPLAASLVIDGLAICDVIEPRGSRPLAGEFAGMPRGQIWAGPQPYLLGAALALSAREPDQAAAMLCAAEELLGRLPAGQEAPARLAATLIRLAVSRRTGDLAGASEALAYGDSLVSSLSGETLERHPEIRAHLLAARGAIEMWSGRIEEAARVLESGISAIAGPGQEYERDNCLGHLALAEALRGRLCRAADLAGQVTAARTGDGQWPPARHPSPAALAARAWVHLEHHEPRELSSLLRQVDASLRISPDKLIGAVACLAAAWARLAEGRAAPAAQLAARARHGWTVPAWLDRKLTMAESQAHLAAGDIRAALEAAERRGCDSSPEADVMLAQARAAAGDEEPARRLLEPVLAAHSGVPERVRLHACLVDARLSYHGDERARGHRSLERALGLAEREQLRLPFVIERSWIRPVLRRDPELARTHQDLFTADGARPAPKQPGAPAQAASCVVEPLTEREREVLRHVSCMLNTAEIANELYISINTVKSHIKSIYRKLAATHRGEAVRRARQLQLI